jgi:dihydrofolate synthase / folylpolyglutamate synthase
MPRPAHPQQRSHGWTQERAERQLHSLELFGMRFGLDRMHRMMTALGSPEQSFKSIQVLGTNGKSSTTRMTAAILQAHGLRTGAYLSPHLISYRERVLIDGSELSPDSFAEGIARATTAAELVNRTLAEDDHVTQFELLTAAAFWQMAEQQIEVAVIEAGLGGRYDATSVIAARVTALTNVGLEHTRWLGPTITDIAEEKLAVLPVGGTLVLGQQPAPEALTVAERVAAERGATIVHARPLEPELALLAKGPFQRRNFALARSIAASFLELAGVAVSEPAIAAAGAATAVPGRLALIGHDPPTLLDGAHNPDAVTALVEAIPGLLGEVPLALVLGVLEDKDAAGMLATLLPLCARVWFTAPPSSRALSPAALQSLARQLGFEGVECEPRAERALAQAQTWARAHHGAVLATGSVYLVGGLLAEIDDGAGAAGAPSTLRSSVG